jgi:hypothetical protein
MAQTATWLKVRCRSCNGILGQEGRVSLMPGDSRESKIAHCSVGVSTECAASERHVFVSPGGGGFRGCEQHLSPKGW